MGLLQITILNTLWMISFVSMVHLTLKFWRNRKNPLLTMICMFVGSMDLVVLLSLFYGDDLINAPRAFCVFQGLALNFFAHATSMTTLCFAIQIYRVIVLNISDDRRIKLMYHLLCFGYPSVMITILAVINFKFNSMKPRNLSCDVMYPPWTRLVGYAGPSLILSIPGMYLSGRAAWMIYCHVEVTESDHINQEDETNEKTECTEEPNGDGVQTHVKVKAEESESEISLDVLTIESDHPESSTKSANTLTKHENLLHKNFSKVQFRIPFKFRKSSKNKGHGVTRGAAIRMASFSLVLLLVNLLVSADTLIYIVHDKVISSNVNLNDIVGSLLGIFMLLMFGTSRERKKRITTNS
ncbi:3137_t:CDS:2 [Acaulospora morrowiae]|uniref:3137_t:CDS:1 n=1 Tax=Acaulospora morrowiae TaxID=94023 RepID=A0A9N9BHB4_9GLOM|nr:3137_t:CDS:2 [Acaulospora morrowiae]